MCFIYLFIYSFLFFVFQARHWCISLDRSTVAGEFIDLTRRCQCQAPLKQCKHVVKFFAAFFLFRTALIYFLSVSVSYRFPNY